MSVHSSCGPDRDPPLSSLQLVPVTRIEKFRNGRGGLGTRGDARKITETDETVMMESRRFTNTALPIFSGTEGWYQHIHIVQAIVKSNGWPEEIAALQLFTHLKGEALNVALLLAKEERESWTGLVDGLAAYYQSTGRLAALRKRISDAFRQPGLDPATYATNLGMLAIQGFGDLTDSGQVDTG